jgi:hypothetical protein
LTAALDATATGRLRNVAYIAPSVLDIVEANPLDVPDASTDTSSSSTNNDDEAAIEIEEFPTTTTTVGGHDHHDRGDGSDGRFQGSGHARIHRLRRGALGGLALAPAAGCRAPDRSPAGASAEVMIWRPHQRPAALRTGNSVDRLVGVLDTGRPARR